MKSHPFVALAAIYIAFLLLAGCASLGVQAPQTFEERAAAATASANAASASVLTLLKARKITPDESDRYIDRCEEAQTAINLARAIHAANPDEGAKQLAVVVAALQTLINELEQRQ